MNGENVISKTLAKQCRKKDQLVISWQRQAKGLCMSAHGNSLGPASTGENLQKMDLDGPICDFLFQIATNSAQF